MNLNDVLKLFCINAVGFFLCGFIATNYLTSIPYTVALSFAFGQFSYLAYLMIKND